MEKAGHQTSREFTFVKQASLYVNGRVLRTDRKIWVPLDQRERLRVESVCWSLGLPGPQGCLEEL